MTIVVTGALGHIGSKLIREFPQYFPDETVVMIDDMSTQRYAALFNLPTQGNYEFIETDVREAPLDSIIEGARVVVHLAALTDATSSFDREDEFDKVNYGGTRRVAEACAAAGVPLIALSSTSVYGTQKTIVDESCGPEDLVPQSPYATSKLREEALLFELGETRGLRFCMPRFGTIFGVSPGMRFHTAVNKFCWQAVLGQELTVWRTAWEQKRPYLDLRDAVRALVFVIKNGVFDNRIYNVVTRNATVGDIVEAIRRHVPDLAVELVDTRIMNQLSYEVSDARIRELGFSAEGDLDKGILETIEWLGNANSTGR